MQSRRPRRAALLIAAIFTVALWTAPLAHAAANNDDATVAKNSSADVIDVLGNDDGLALHVTGSTDPPHGTADCSSQTQCLYTPDTDFLGDDTFDYTVAGIVADPPLTATVTVHVVPDEADIAISTYADPDPVGTGASFVWHVIASNSGSGLPSSAVTVTDQLPAGEGAGATLPPECNAVGDVVTCTLQPLGPGDSNDMMIAVTAPGSAQQLTNNVSIAQAPPRTDPNTGDNAGSATVQVYNGGDLGVYTYADDVASGQDLGFSTTTYNAGPKDTTGTTTVNTITGGTITGSPQATGQNCTIAHSPERLTCVAPDPFSGTSGSAVAQFTVHPDSADAVVSNHVAVSGTGNDDPSPYNDVADWSAVAGNPSLADISIEKYGARYAVAGSTYTYQIDAGNYGPAGATGVTVHDTLPADMTVNAVTTDVGNCTHDATSITCSLGALADGAFAHIELTVDVGVASGSRANTATVSATSADRYPSDNSAKSVVDILGPGATDLEADIEGPHVAAASTAYHYYAWIYNNGPADATGATWTLGLPPGGYDESGAGAPVATLDDGTPCTAYVAGSHLITCPSVAIANHDYRSVAVTIKPDGTAPSLALNTQISKVGDPDPDNDQRSLAVKVYPAGSADLDVTQNDSADPAARNEPLEYDVTVRNDGPFDGTGVTVTDTLPADSTFVSAKRDDGSDCPAPTAGVLHCNVGDIPAGEVASVALVVTPTADGLVTNAASAALGSGSDPDAANNSSSESTLINENVADNTTGTSSTGRSSVDPDTGLVTITMARGNKSALTLSTTAVCAGAVNSVTFLIGTVEFPAANTSGNVWEATVPVDSIQSGDVLARVSCNATLIVNQIGEVHLYDPSGVIRDASTHQPVGGATIRLYKVPGWTARTSSSQNATANTCESNLSKAAGANWTQAAPTGLGVPADPASGEINPALNPLTTTADGRYGWNVAAGCWYVVVSKTGYDTLTSPVVGVPPEVTDLDLDLSKTVAGTGGGGGGGGDGGGGGGGGGSTPATATTTPTTSTSPPPTTPAGAKCVVPKLVGLSVAKARKALAKAHCGVGRITKKATKAHKGKKKIKKGTVVAQSPKAGTKKPAGSKVALTIAK